MDFYKEVGLRLLSFSLTLFFFFVSAFSVSVFKLLIRVSISKLFEYLFAVFVAGKEGMDWI